MQVAIFYCTAFLMLKKQRRGMQGICWQLDYVCMCMSLSLSLSLSLYIYIEREREREITSKYTHIQNWLWINLKKSAKSIIEQRKHKREKKKRHNHPKEKTKNLPSLIWGLCRILGQWRKENFAAIHLNHSLTTIKY